MIGLWTLAERMHRARRWPLPVWRWLRMRCLSARGFSTAPMPVHAYAPVKK